MKTLDYQRPHDLGKLHDELVAAIPELRPVVGADGLRQPVMTIEDRGDRIRMTVPDDANIAAIEAIVNAHDPTPPPVVPTKLKAAMTEAETKIGAMQNGPAKDAAIAQYRALRLTIRALFDQDQLHFHDYGAGDVSDA